jgi:hypothetical protein
MPTETEDIKPLNVRDLLNWQDAYEIPVYQRNYAWESKEIEQLIQDVIDFSLFHAGKNYYIGTLVVAGDEKDPRVLLTIDGQQRLTTLAILTSVLKNDYQGIIDVSWFEGINLHYASREKSANSMNAVFRGTGHPAIFEPAIFSAYEICRSGLTKKIKENDLNIQQFADYLYRFVIILRVPLPKGIDLNHYFEIMNSRGEQLEKHEVLKAVLMKVFNSVDKPSVAHYERCFNMVWEACSNMERYVQYGFNTECRHLIFGQNDWNVLAVDDFDEFVNKIAPAMADGNIGNAMTIEDIIKGPGVSFKESVKDDTPEKFNTVINFPNFLLHVLRVQTGDNNVALDDKRLLVVFEDQLPKDLPGQLEFVKCFIFNLLKCKLLFDKYIIKREYTGGSDRWSLKSLTWYSSGNIKNGSRYLDTFPGNKQDSFLSESRRILMLLAMFHTVQPSMAYKYWLNAALNYLFKQVKITEEHYIAYLEHIAKTFVFDNYLAKNPKNYFEMIFQNPGPVHRDIENIDFNKLQYENLENNLVFNFLDYLLWMDMKDKGIDQRVKTFDFTPRSSVEHYYPQVPIEKAIETIAAADLHAFGNLCLISHEKNSRLNNHIPTAKKDYYSGNPTIDSVKQFVMMQYPHWTVKEMWDHNTQMIRILTENLDSDYCADDHTSQAQKWFDHYRRKDPILLIRAILCFGDCARYAGGNKYNLFDFEYIQNHHAFKDFEVYVASHNSASLLTIIEEKLEDGKLKFSYRYLFVKYPALLSFCKEGNFQWFDAHDGRLVYLLSAQRKTDHKSKELYCYLMELYINQHFKVRSYSNTYGIYIKMGYNNSGYYLTDNDQERALELWIMNENGERLNYLVKPFVNGNARAVQQLYQRNWVRNTDGKFERFGKQELIKLGADNRKNADGVIAALNSVLRNGFGIKL